MPTYVYECEQEHEFELHRPISERDDEATCRICGSPAERVLFPQGANAVVLPRRFHNAITAADLEA